MALQNESEPVDNRPAATTKALRELGASYAQAHAEAEFWKMECEDREYELQILRIMMSDQDDRIARLEEGHAIENDAIEGN